MSEPSTSASGRQARPRQALSNVTRGILVLLALLSLGFLTAYHRQNARLEIDAMPRRAFREGYVLPSSNALRVIALGHSEVAADLVWLRALNYFAVHFGLDRDYRWLDSYISTIIALDPNFRMIYQWAGVVTMYGGQEIDNEAVHASNRFLLLGHERYPEEWTYPFMLGCNYRFELQPENDEQAAEWRVLGAQYLRRAAALPGSPSWLSSTASAILGRYGQVDEAVAIDTESFLSASGLRSGTLRASNSMYRMNPTYGSTQGDFRDMVGRGLRLRSILPPSEWTQLLLTARRAMADRETDVGFLRRNLSVLTFGPAEERVAEVPFTPLDDVFYVTLDALGVGAGEAHPAMRDDTP